MLYLDHAATTPLHPDVLAAMLPHLGGTGGDGAGGGLTGNASSVHRLGRQARGAVEEARRRVADVLGVEAAAVVFTSGGTEADNLALRGTVGRGRALVTGAAEHEAVLRTAAALEGDGRRVVRLDPEPSTGAVTADALAAALDATPEVALVSLMAVNNETGATTDLAAIAAVCRARGVPLHTDAVQAAGLLPLRPICEAADLVTLSGHKMNGPVGVGVLVAPGHVRLAATQTGGMQERGRRAGTENVAAIAGFAAALDRAAAGQAARAERLTVLRDRLAARLISDFGDAVHLTTPLATAAPHIVHVAFPPGPTGPIDGEMLILGLDLDGICASAGSACTSGALSPSHVLTALGLDRATASAAVRFSLGESTTDADVDAAAAALVRVARRLGVLVATPTET